MDIRIDRMTDADMAEIIPIEKASFPSPWSEKLFREALAVPVTRAFCAREEGPESKLIGYIVCHHILDELHILSIASHPAYLRKKIGTALLKYCLNNNMPVKVAYLEVRENNKPARAFYRGMGFREVGKRKRYYSDTGDDAVIMAWNLDK